MTSGTTVVEAPPEVDAVSPDLVVDEVVQATPEQIDVLWVVDDSGSMANEQTLLALEFPRFMQLVLDSHADVHIGVVTTDASGAEGGALEQAAAFRWVTPDTPNPVGTFLSSLMTTMSVYPRSIAPLMIAFKEAFFRGMHSEFGKMLMSSSANLNLQYVRSGMGMNVQHTSRRGR